MTSWESAAEAAVAHYSEQLRPYFAGRKFVLFGGQVVGLAGLAAGLARLGGEAFLLGGSRGRGPCPRAASSPGRRSACAAGR
jgi:hypothetical protein